MILSLDTHVLLCALSAPEQLSKPARDAIEDPANIVFVSAAVAWEIEIKAALGKLRAPSDLVNQLAAANFQELPITVEHTLALKQLPNLHRDPFDRIMLAQAKAAGLTFVTADPEVLQYPGSFLRGR
ncbi:MAG: type II toxin-antitoxin system VapC family toxin [Verrucomicrobia bacterium]|nr:type II toxin-antitoxin system VapC family toxin [Verrucomicrobiota bacterium]